MRRTFSSVAKPDRPPPDPAHRVAPTLPAGDTVALRGLFEIKHDGRQTTSATELDRSSSRPLIIVAPGVHRGP
jgi:hypothetical protein